MKCHFYLSCALQQKPRNLSSNSETSKSDNMEKVSNDGITKLLQQRLIAAHGSFSAHETIQIVMTSPLQQTQAYIARKLMNPFINPKLNQVYTEQPPNNFYEALKSTHKKHQAPVNDPASSSCHLRCKHKQNHQHTNSKASNHSSSKLAIVAE